MAKKMNRAERIVRRYLKTVQAKYPTLDAEMQMNWVWHRIREYLQLDSGYADIPNKTYPPEYKAALDKVGKEIA